MQLSLKNTYITIILVYELYFNNLKGILSILHKQLRNILKFKHYFDKSPIGHKIYPLNVLKLLTIMYGKAPI